MRHLRISVIMPCLNEETTIGSCIRQVKKGLLPLRKLHYTTEIIVVDNGSTDQSHTRAKQAGAKVVKEPRRGYGSAYLAGLSSARGDYLIMGDSDGSYDFTKLSPFIEHLEDGADIVLGSRFKGTILPGAMSFSHQYLGNPILTTMLNVFYRSRISDAHTGMRAFTKAAVKRLNLQSHGMEFASEMIVKAIFHHMRIDEVPIRYLPRGGNSKLSPLRDTWRHIKFMLLYAPTYALIIPGSVFFLLGFIITIFLLPQSRKIGRVSFDINTMASGITMMNLGVQTIFIGIFSRLFTQKKLGVSGGSLGNWLLSTITPEKVLVLGATVVLFGAIPFVIILLTWIQKGFGDLTNFRNLIAASGFVLLGIELMFSAYLFGLLEEDR